MRILCKKWMIKRKKGRERGRGYKREGRRKRRKEIENEGDRRKQK